MEAQKKAGAKVCFKRVTTYCFTDTYIKVKHEIDSTWPEWKKSALSDSNTYYNNQDLKKFSN